MSTWLTEQWVATMVAESGDLAGPSTLSGRIQVDVTGGDAGDAALSLEFAGGKLVGGAMGPGDAPDAVLTLTDVDAQAVLAGDLDSSVAFMQGRMKVAGDMAIVLDLLAMSATDDARASRSRIAAATAG